MKILVNGEKNFDILRLSKSYENKEDVLLSIIFHKNADLNEINSVFNKNEGKPKIELIGESKSLVFENFTFFSLSLICLEGSSQELTAILKKEGLE